jgi:hypothetical protein
MHKMHNIMHKENATVETKVFTEDVEGFLEDRDDDCLSGNPSIGSPTCWQMMLPDGWAVTFIVRRQIPIKETIRGLSAATAKIQLVNKIRAGDASGGHCKSKGGQTCLKYPAATCLEVPENPCPEGTGCVCQHADGPVFAIAYVIDMLSLVVFGTIISGGNVKAGILLAFHPPKFGLPGPTMFLIAGGINMIKLGFRLPVCTCQQLPCAMNHALNHCQVYPQSGVVPWNQHYCLPERGWKCATHGTTRCKMKKCASADDGIVGPTGQAVLNCQGANVTRDVQLQNLQDSGVTCHGVGADRATKRLAQKPPWSPLDLPFGLGMRVN